MRNILFILLCLASLCLPSTDTLHASTHGCVLNTNLMTGGGTDDGTALQTILSTDSASANSLYVFIDGPARISTTLSVHSNTTIDFTTVGSGIFLTASSNCPIFWNLHKSPLIKNDHNIKFIGTYLTGNGGFLNGNGENQSTQMVDGTFVVGMDFSGIKNITISGLYLYDTQLWGITITNVDTALINNYKYHIKPGSTRISQDGLDIRGPGNHVTIKNCLIHSYDDAIALNARDNGESSMSLGPWQGNGGKIVNVLIDSITLDSALYGINMLTDTSLIDTIQIKNVTGYVSGEAINITNYPFSPYTTITNGNFGSQITIDTVHVSAYSTSLFQSYGTAEYIGLHANINKLTINKFTIDSTSYDYRPFIWVYPGFTVGLLNINNFTENDTSSQKDTTRFRIDGTVTGLTINSAVWTRKSIVDAHGSFIGLTGTIDSLKLGNVSQNRSQFILDDESGSLTSIWDTGTTQTYGVSSFNCNGGTVSGCYINNWTGQIPVTGTATITSETGNAFPFVSELGSDLLAYFPFENAKDTTGHITTLSNNGAVTYSAGHINNSAWFSSSNLYHTDDTALSVTAGLGWTWAGWIKDNSLFAYDVILRKSSNLNNAYDYEYGIDASASGHNIRVICGNGISPYFIITSSQTLDNNWHFINIRYNSATNYAYIQQDNNTPDSSYYIWNIAHESTPVGFAGSYSGGTWYNGFVGSIDELGFWNRCLSKTELSELYNSGAGIAYRSLVSLSYGISKQDTIGKLSMHTVNSTGSLVDTYYVYSGSLPSGYTLNNKTGLISGTPATSVNDTVTILGKNLWNSNKTQLILLTASTGPTISIQPSPLSVVDGAPGVDSVTATGTGTLTYQWYKNSTLIAGATSRILSYVGVYADSGQSGYVTVTNANGSTTSGTFIFSVSKSTARRHGGLFGLFGLFLGIL